MTVFEIFQIILLPSKQVDFIYIKQQKKHRLFNLNDGLMFSPQSIATLSCFLTQQPVEPLK